MIVVHAAGAVHMTEEVTRKVSDKQERDNVDEVDNCLADDVLVRLVRRKKKKHGRKKKKSRTKWNEISSATMDYK